MPVSGFVLAGGRSSRMGVDKALLPLGGKPLIALAVSKLQRLCDDAAILGANPAYAAYAPLVPDLHPDCGPIGGIEAALAHARHPWSLILPVDVPFLPESLLADWVESTVDRETVRASLFQVDDVPQPTILLIHRDLAPAVARAVREGKYKLFPVLQTAAQRIADQRGLGREDLLNVVQVADGQRPYFANLNTPQEWDAARKTEEDIIEVAAASDRL